MADTFKIIAIIAYTLSFVFLVCSVWFWFKFKMYQIVRRKFRSEKAAPKSVSSSRINTDNNKSVVPSVSEKAAEQHADADGSARTELLSAAAGNINDTEFFSDDDPATQVLDDEATELMSGEELTGELSDADFQIIDSIVLIHTEEVI